MKTAYPLGAILGLLICLLVIANPVRDTRKNEHYARQQQAAKVAANKKLFKKLYTDAEGMTFPVGSYKDESK